MIKFAKIVNNELGLVEVGLGTNADFYKSIGMSEMDVAQSDIDNAWYLSELCPMKTPEQKDIEEKERIAKLKLTRGDVFRALLMAKQVTRAMIRTQLEMLPEETPEQILTKEMALIDFDEALDFYRGNSLIDTVGLTLGITSEQLDRFFETNDYKYLTNVTVTINPTPENAIVLINEVEGLTLAIPYESDVNYEVSADGYITVVGEKLGIIEDTVIDVELVGETTIEDIPAEDLSEENSFGSNTPLTY